ncbi:PREDICTED: RNA-directed DNA polymerase from mobile element jockey-like, partial [Habropoda laboriosa]|uniref:RNA-directed DNA polymerase from mobile element jockey-like n=1 Tax=Habropoda laboriosa TaxID=597456 RepID=UPI00083CEBA8
YEQRNKNTRSSPDLTRSSDLGKQEESQNPGTSDTEASKNKLKSARHHAGKPTSPYDILKIRRRSVTQSDSPRQEETSKETGTELEHTPNVPTSNPYHILSKCFAKEKTDMEITPNPTTEPPNNKQARLTNPNQTDIPAQQQINNPPPIHIHTRITEFKTLIATLKGAAYLPQQQKLTPQLLDSLTTHRCHFIIGGDLNSKHRTWNNPTANTNGNILYNHINSNNYYILHSDTYTHKTPKSRHSNIDIYLTNLTAQTICHTIQDLSSNHLPVILTIGNTNVPYTNKLLTHTDWDAYKASCNRHRINHRIHTTQDLDKEIHRLNATIQNAYNQATTKTKIYVRTYTPDLKLLELIKTRNRHRRKYQKTGHPEHKLVRNYLTTLIDKHISQIKQTHWQQKLKTLTTADSSLWKTYKTLQNKPRLIPPLTAQASTAYSNKEKAELLAHTFQQIHQTTSSQTSPWETEVRNAILTTWNNNEPIDTSFISLRLITQLIRPLKNKAPEPDKITATQIKNLPRRPILQLYYIYRYAYKHSYFPDPWKTAKVAPYPKPRKNPTYPQNYRPISLLSILSKILERHTKQTKHTSDTK